MDTILSLLIGLVVLAFLFYLIKEILGIITRKWPAFIWIAGIGLGLLAGFVFHWIVGIIVCFFAIGILASCQESGHKKCTRCGSYDTTFIERTSAEGHTAELWECNKCGQQTIFWN